ncbi:hypothetical protein METSCH_A11680 [Metschnikowia aff. pulcherrima]|uniref:Uncharacterized protein n=1 Tax=Metschnikowia aff. pulcherrima TaxID=2163413 RepID=A0A4V1ADQ4_9ASCO|nr:hypothetical protein METSCH_A11680 [Metschnikowia aff. pulcherrima]
MRCVRWGVDLARGKSNLVLGSELLGSVHHVGQRGLGLLPASGLQTTVRVDPELVGWVNLQDLGDSRDKLLLGRNSWRVNVEQAQANVVRVVRELSDVVGVVLLGELNGHNVGVQSLDVVRVQVGVAEVRVDLRGVLDTGGGDSEGLSSPVQVVGSLLASSQRQALSDGRLVHLDHGDTGSLQVLNLVSQGQAQLQGLHLLRNVVSWERPSETGHRTGQHTLDRQLGQGLRVNGLLHGHGLRSGHVTNNDRWSHVSGAVRLHPAVGGEHVTVQLLTKVLHHVVSLWLTVHQDVQANFLLESDHSLDLLLDELLVLLLGDRALGELVSVDSDILGLRERTNGGGWEQRQVVFLLLLSQSVGKWHLSGGQRLVDCGQSLLHLRVGGDGGLLSGLDRLGVGGVNLLHVLARYVLGNGDHGVQLLRGKLEPVGDDRVQLGLVSQVHRSVQQRRGGGNDDSVLAQLGNGLVHKGRRLGVVGLPDVSAVHNTDREGLVVANNGQHVVELSRGSGEVEVEALNWQALESSQVGSHVTKVGGQGDLWQALAHQLLEGGLVQVLHRLWQVQHQDRLVNLHGLGASLVKLSEQRLVDRQELVQQRDRVQVQRVLVGLTQVQVRDWAEHDWSGLNTQLLGLQELLDGLQAGTVVQLELGGVGESGSDVVVVRVEPLDHLQGGHIHRGLGLGGLSLQTSTHGKQHVDWLQAKLGVSVWDHVEQKRQVQHLVVEGEIVRGDHVDASIFLQLPVVGSDLLTLGQQLLDRHLLGPVGLGHLLQLSLSTNTGKT